MNYFVRSSIRLERTLNVAAIRCMGTCSRGSRGHGWFLKYRQGLDGRHLHGRYHDRNVSKLVAMNNKVFDLNKSVDCGSQKTLAYLDIAVGGDDKENIRRIVIELAAAALPKTCQNFINLCQDSYAMSKLFRIEKNVGVCFGDYVSPNQDGTAGKCHSRSVNSSTSQEPDTFEYEPLVLSHAQKGIVSMLSGGYDKNDSRFIITTVDDAPQLDGRFVAFGRVQQGLADLERIALSTFTKKGRPAVDIRIVASGVF